MPWRPVPFTGHTPGPLLDGYVLITDR